MDLDKMLARCRREQWSADDLDWTRPPRPMAPEDEAGVVQLFTDMVGIEELAGALFDEQRRRAVDPTLRAIFETFVTDELRHAEVARRLAAHYDVRRLRIYRRSPSLERFAEALVGAIRYLGDEVASGYIMAGELMLDIALLRSIDEHVADETSSRAMKLVDRDESRHIAIDYHMLEVFGSDAYERRLPGRPGARDRIRAARTLARLLRRAQPFMRDVFFEPMGRIDPSGRRLRDAMRRIQLVTRKPELERRPFSRFVRALQDVAAHPRVGPLAAPVAARLLGVPRRFLEPLYTPAELARVRTARSEDLARDTLGDRFSG